MILWRAYKLSIILPRVVNALFIAFTILCCSLYGGIDTSIALNIFLFKCGMAEPTLFSRKALR